MAFSPLSHDPLPASDNHNSTMSLFFPLKKTFYAQSAFSKAESNRKFCWFRWGAGAVSHHASTGKHTRGAWALGRNFPAWSPGREVRSRKEYFGKPVAKRTRRWSDSIDSGGLAFEHLGKSCRDNGLNCNSDFGQVDLPHGWLRRKYVDISLLALFWLGRTFPLVLTSTEYVCWELPHSVKEEQAKVKSANIYIFLFRSVLVAVFHTYPGAGNGFPVVSWCVLKAESRKSPGGTANGKLGHARKPLWLNLLREMPVMRQHTLSEGSWGSRCS